MFVASWVVSHEKNLLQTGSELLDRRGHAELFSRLSVATPVSSILSVLIALTNLGY